MSVSVRAITLVGSDDFPTDTPPVTSLIDLPAFNASAATAEPSEPAHAGSPARHSVWFRFTAVQDGCYSVRRPPGAEGINLRVGVYTNSTLATLGAVRSGSIDDALPEIFWEAKAGETYSIAFDTSSKTTIQLRAAFSQFYLRTDSPTLRLAPGGTARLEAVSTGSYDLSGGVRFAVLNGPINANGRPSTVEFAKVTSPPWVATYTNLTGGVVDLGAFDALGELSLGLMFSNETPGDAVANAIELQASFVRYDTLLSMGTAGTEAGEFLPLHSIPSGTSGTFWFGTPGTLWFHLRPGFDDRVNLSSNPDGVWAVYRGNPLGQTNPVAQFNRLAFDAVAGEDYFLQLLVAGEPQTRRFDSVAIFRDSLQVVLPPSARTVDPTNWVFAATTPVIRVVVSNRFPDKPVVGVRLNGQLPSGTYPDGTPYFDWNVSFADSGMRLTPSATNDSGVSVAGRPVVVGFVANDAPGTAIPVPSGFTIDTVNLRFASWDPSDPPQLGKPGTPTRWWRYEAAEDGYSEIQISATDGASLGVFTADGDRLVSVGIPRPIAPNLTLISFPTSAGKTYLVGIGGTGNVGLYPMFQHKVRWTGLDAHFNAGKKAVIGLWPVGVSSAIVDEIRWNDTVLATSSAIPSIFDAVPPASGLTTLSVTYRIPNFSGQTKLVVPVLVSPANDDLEAAVPLDIYEPTQSTGFAGAAEVAATRESSEPDPGGAGLGTVWFSFQPIRGGTYRVMPAPGVPLPRDLAVFEGGSNPTYENVREVLRGGDGGADLGFSAVAGKTYYLSVSADRFYSLRIIWRPPGDAFADAPWLPGIDPDFVWNPAVAGAEPGEPTHGGSPARHSFWWVYEAPASGILVLPFSLYDSGPSAVDPAFGIYQGDTLGSLAPVPFKRANGGDSGSVRWNVERGQTYRIAADSGTTFRLGLPVLQTLDWATVPPRVVAGKPLAIHLVDLDPAEPKATVKLIPEAGTIRGSGLDWEWIPVGKGSETLNVVYRRGTNSEQSFTVRVPITPHNDDFADADILGFAGASAVASGNFVYASREAGEPVSVGDGKPTLWYAWTCSESGLYEVFVASPVSHGCEVVSGASLSALERVDSGPLPRGSRVFTATSGNTYRIVVSRDSPDVVPADIFFDLRLFRSADNDSFDARRVFDGSRRVVYSTVFGATADAGEPEPARAGVWFEYRPARGGTVRFGAMHAGDGLRVFRGTQLGSLESLMPDGVDLPEWAGTATAGEPMVIEMAPSAGNQAQPEGSALYVIPPGDPAGDASDLIANRLPLPVGQTVNEIVFAPGQYEAVEAAMLPSLVRSQTLWWGHVASGSGRLLVRVSATNDSAGSIPPALAALEELPDGSFRPLANLDSLRPLALDLVNGQRVAIRLAGMPGAMANLDSEWTATPGTPVVVFDVADDGSHRVRFASVPGQPYTIHQATSPSGPWTPLRSVDRAGPEVSVSLDPESRDTMFYRATSP